MLNRTSGLTRPLLISLRNAFRRRQRMALTLLTLAVGGAVYLGALNLRAAIRGSVDLLFRAHRFDIALRFERPAAADTLERLVAGVPGVTRAEAWGAARASVARADDLPGNTFPLAAPPAGSRSIEPAILDGRWFGETDGAVLVVNRRLLDEEPALAPGGDVTLIVGGRPTSWSVIGVVDTGPSPVAYVPRAALAAAIGDAHVDRVVVDTDLEGSASQLELVQRLRDRLGREGHAIDTTQLMEQNRRVTEDHLLMVAGFLGVMAQLMILVGGLGLASTMSLAVLERTREIGVLRAIGARHGSILALLQLEGLVVALLGWLIALPLSVPMSVVLGRAFARIMLPVPVILVPDPSGVLQWLAVSLIVSVAACAWPAFRATRIPTAAALAYE